MRLVLRPLITLSATVSGLGIRFGPRGIEMWPLWAWFHSAGDSLGRLAPLARGARIERIRLPGCRADYVRAPGVDRGTRAILYMHGGGFVAGGLGTYRRFASILSTSTDATVLNVGYRLLPRSPITHAIEDGMAGYRRLLEDGFEPQDIVIGGDSAGGGLVFLVAYAIVSSGLPSPAGLFALSPWADLDVAEKLAHASARRDPVIPIRAAGFVVEKLVQKGAALDRELSPVNLDLRGLPPVLIHVGTTEVLAVDAIKLARVLDRAGVPVTLKHWHGQVHDFQVLGLDVVPEARRSLKEIGTFVARLTAS
jgi:acetyl esterase/lipase